MTITGEALRELHRIHRQLTDLRSRLQRGPRQVAAADAGVRKLDMEAEQAKAAAQKARIAADEKQLQLKAREDRIDDLQNKLNSASSNKEYQALKEQIAADKQANLVLQDEILEALEKLDELGEQVQTAEANLAKAREEGGKTKQRVESEQGGLESELARLQEELAVAETRLPEEFKDHYRRVAKARGEGVLAQVEGEVCGGCFHTLTHQMMNQLYLSQPVFCNNCGAMLYLAEGRTARDG